MAIFARKHFSKERARMFSLLINFAILLRASVSLASRFAKRISVPILDGILLYLGLFAICHGSRGDGSNCGAVSDEWL